MIGLGTMGRNFLLNVGEKGFSGIGYNRHADKLQLLLEERGGLEIEGVSTLSEFVSGLAIPRKIMLLVPAGDAVDSVIAELLPYLKPNDLVIDGGNSHFIDTERREMFLNERGIEFLGVGVSGGEEGARYGASIMIGGSPAAYELVREIFEEASAKVNGEPCAAHVGVGSSGHFVKMVHNGIEYGLMQLLAETYDFMQRVLKMDYAAMSQTFSEWNENELNSFLVEITAKVLRKIEPETGRPLVSMILDTAGQKGTGRWTSQAAMDFGIPIPTIDSAVSMRQISSQKATRGIAASKYEISQPKLQIRDEPSLEDLKNALICSVITTYAQGVSLLQAASTEKNYNINLAEIAKIWRGGCIIRSAMLEDIRGAYAKDPSLANLIIDDNFARILRENSGSWRDVVAAFTANGIPSLCFSSALSYFDALVSERLPANLIQAQRDFFGAHTYKRIDKDGTFHTSDWDS